MEYTPACIALRKYNRGRAMTTLVTILLVWTAANLLAVPLIKYVVWDTKDDEIDLPLLLRRAQ